jgi:hypothetical protein
MPDYMALCRPVEPEEALGSGMYEQNIHERCRMPPPNSILSSRLTTRGYADYSPQIVVAPRRTKSFLAHSGSPQVLMIRVCCMLWPRFIRAKVVHPQRLPKRAKNETKNWPNWQAARDWFQKSLDNWKKVKNHWRYRGDSPGTGFTPPRYVQARNREPASFRQVKMRLS